MSWLKRNLVLAFTVVGVLLREALIFAGVTYDSGIIGTALFFLGEGLSILVILAGDLLDYIFPTRTAVHYAISLILGLLAAFFLDRLIAKLRRN